ncbi:MAG TPA: hypothetical protein VE011_11080 [Candidatus Dormibacteraeota bacterium]|nr:hypothetical protein [Candidatus Dormibacteraeota bacterium]
MAKRTRYGNKPKPAAKRPTRAAAASPAAAPAPSISRAPAARQVDAQPFEGGDDMPMVSSSSLTEAEVARAAQLEAEATARERAAIAESLRRRAGGGAIATHTVGDVNAPLSVRMSHEYAYVARDVKRILLTAGLMVAILAVLDILVNVMGVITL